jgi:gliding motility-associated-like protein
MIDGETTCLNGDTPLTLLSNSNDAATSFWLNENNIQVASTADFTIENANADDSGNYFFVAESAIGCQNIDTINVQITNGLPQIEAMLVGQPCEDGNLTLSSTEIQNAAYTWINPKGDNFSSAQSPLVALASTEFNGTYTVTATADGCSTTDSVAVEILEAPTAIDDEFPVITNAATEFNVLVNDGFDANEAMTVTVLQSTTQGTLTQVNDGTFSYTPKEGSLETDMFAYQICYDACPNTCDIAFVQLNVQFPTDNCTATTVITPNDDGINDRFVVFCLDVQDFPENELIIYGGWGDEVFRMTGYDNSWKGTYENEPLPDGTYYYIFKRDPNAEAEKGFVMIYR